MLRAARRARVPTRGAVRTASNDIVAGTNGDVAATAARLATGLSDSTPAGRDPPVLTVSERTDGHPQDGTRISRSHRTSLSFGPGIAWSLLPGMRRNAEGWPMGETDRTGSVR